MKAIRIGFDVPRYTHRYFIEELIEYPHPKVMLCSRFIKFYMTVSTSKKEAVRLLANISKIDEKTVFSKNLSQIAKETKTEIKELTPHIVKKEMQYFAVPEEEQWRIPFLHNLLRIRCEEWTIDNFANSEIKELIEYVCTT